MILGAIDHLNSKLLPRLIPKTRQSGSMQLDLGRNYGLAGDPSSSPSGLYYHLLRWYDPSTGRFISQDPLAGGLSDPQSQNPYVYARNVPTGLTDPSGAGFGSDCHDSLCAAPIRYYTGDLPPDVDPYVRDMCLQNRFMCPTILRYYGYRDNLNPERIVSADVTGPGSSDSMGTGPANISATIEDTAVIQDIGSGAGGATPGQIGEQYESYHLFNQFGQGNDPEYTKVQKTFRDPAIGRIGRVDYYFDNGQARFTDETKGGYVSGRYYVDQVGKYQRVANQQGATFRYFLCGGASQPFKEFLTFNQIWFTDDCGGYGLG